MFSKNYLPVARINIKRAIVLLVTGQAETLEFSSTQQWEVRSPSVVLQIPDHIRLTSGNPERHWKLPPVNRREVFRRDKTQAARTTPLWPWLLSLAIALFVFDVALRRIDLSLLWPHPLLRHTRTTTAGRHRPAARKVAV